MRISLTTSAIIIFLTMAAFSPKNGLIVTSASFGNNGLIPLKYSCEGAQVSPPLHIGNIPAEAKSLALIVHDPDAPIKGGFTHWVLWNIDVNGDIPEGFGGGIAGLNGAQQNKYYPMCPPSGTHHYHFMVYALDTKLQLSNITNRAGLEHAIQGHILAEGELVGLYKKMK